MIESRDACGKITSHILEDNGIPNYDEVECCMDQTCHVGMYTQYVFGGGGDKGGIRGGVNDLFGYPISRVGQHLKIRLTEAQNPNNACRFVPLQDVRGWVGLEPQT